MDLVRIASGGGGGALQEMASGQRHRRDHYHWAAFLPAPDDFTHPFDRLGGVHRAAAEFHDDHGGVTSGFPAADFASERPPRPSSPQPSSPSLPPVRPEKRAGVALKKQKGAPRFPPLPPGGRGGGWERGAGGVRVLLFSLFSRCGGLGRGGRR